jgi:hypothetical protein
LAARLLPPAAAQVRQYLGYPNWLTANSRRQTAPARGFFRPGFWRDNREIDFYAPKLRRRGEAKGRFLGETARIKALFVAEFCYGRAANRFEKPWISRGLRGEF